MTEEQVKKEMLCRMIIRCNKVKKHTPKKVKTPALKIDGKESNTFPEEELKKKHYGGTETLGVRCALKHYIQD